MALCVGEAAAPLELRTAQSSAANWAPKSTGGRRAAEGPSRLIDGAPLAPSEEKLIDFLAPGGERARKE